MRVFAKEYALISHALDSQESRTRPAKMGNSLAICTVGIFVFTFTVNRFHIYGALLHLALKVFTFTRPYYIFTFRGAALTLLIYLHSKHLKQTLSPDMVFYLEQLKKKTREFKQN